MIYTLSALPWWIYPIMIWELVWKGLAMWKCGRNNQLTWFVFILILNTAGILPIIYLVWFQRTKVKKPQQVKKKRR